MTIIAEPGRTDDADAATFPRLVSVVIPALNEAATLPGQLEALSRQTYRGPWEVIVADNGSTDGTAAVASAWRDRLPALRVVDASGRRGAPYARNIAVAAAHGDLIGFCDADDVATPGWLDALVRASRNADVVRGPLDRVTLNGSLAIDSANGWEAGAPVPAHRFLPFASASNVAIRVEVLRALGGWSEQYAVADDKDLSWRAQLAGYRFAIAPGAVTLKRDRGNIRALWRQWFRYAAEDVHLYVRFREHGMPRTTLGEVLGGWAGVFAGVPFVALGGRRRRVWVRLLAQRCGRVAGSVRFRAVYL